MKKRGIGVKIVYNYTKLRTHVSIEGHSIGRVVARELGKGRVVRVWIMLKGLAGLVHTCVLYSCNPTPTHPHPFQLPSAGEQTKLDKDNLDLIF
jgi:hypothetical protein